MALFYKNLYKYDDPDYTPLTKEYNGNYLVYNNVFHQNLYYGDEFVWTMNMPPVVPNIKSSTWDSWKTRCKEGPVSQGEVLYPTGKINVKYDFLYNKLDGTEGRYIGSVDGHIYYDSTHYNIDPEEQYRLYLPNNTFNIAGGSYSSPYATTFSEFMLGIDLSNGETFRYVDDMTFFAHGGRFAEPSSTYKGIFYKPISPNCNRIISMEQAFWASYNVIPETQTDIYIPESVESITRCFEITRRNDFNIHLGPSISGSVGSLSWSSDIHHKVNVFFPSGSTTQTTLLSDPSYTDMIQDSPTKWHKVGSYSDSILTFYGV